MTKSCCRDEPHLRSSRQIPGRFPYWSRRKDERAPRLFTEGKYGLP